MIEKGLAFQSSRLREDELELEVPSNFIAGRLGGAHSLQRISGREPSPASRLDGSLWERASAGLGLPGGRVPVPGVFAVSGCVRAVSLAVRLASRGLVWAPLPLPAVPPCDLRC